MRIVFHLALAAICVATLVSNYRIVRAEEPAGRGALGAKLTDAEEAEERYKVPEGTPEELLTFINRLEKYRPKDLRDSTSHRQKAPKAILEAAAKIMATEKNKDSDAYKKAANVLVELRSRTAGSATPEEQAKLLDEIKTAFAAKESFTGRDLQMASNFASAVADSGNYDLATKAFGEFGDIFTKSSNAELAEYAEGFKAQGHRYSLFHKFFDVTGKTVGGDDFDWKKYRGKVVLVDFWATWCGPCLGELPNVKENYAKYHDKGFDVVGISIDEDREKLEAFLEQEKLPWTTLNEDKAGWNSAIAKLYGINGIPTVILVDQEGKVVSFNARGPELGALLEKLLGGAPGAGSSTEKSPGDKPGKS